MRKDTVIKHFGSQTATAKALGITQGAVSKWPDPIPHLRAMQVEVVTAGQLKAKRPH